MRRFICLFFVVICMLSILATTVFASAGVNFIIASNGSYDYGGGGYKNDTSAADVMSIIGQNMSKGMRYIIRNGLSSAATTQVSGYVDRYDTSNFSISYYPAYQTTGNRSIWGRGLGGSSYTVKASGKFYP